MIESPAKLDSWFKMYTSPYGGNEGGWATSNCCIRNEQLAQMKVLWIGAGHDTVDICVREYPDIQPDQTKSEIIIEITVPVSDAREKIDETVEAWITAIDNE